MLRLSRLGDYSTAIMAHLAHEPVRLSTAGEVAAALGLGLPTVSKLLKRLAREGLLVSHRGARGGYSLARSADEISVAQILDAVEGRIAMTECSLSPGRCRQEPSCQVRAGWLRVNDLVRATLEGVRLTEFARPASPSPAHPPQAVMRRVRSAA